MNPAINFAKDFGAGDGSYVELALSQDFAIGDVANIGKITITPDIAIGYNDHLWREKSGFSHVKLGVVAPVEISDKLIIGPSFSQIISLDKGLDKKLGAFANQTYAGVSAKYSL